MEFKYKREYDNFLSQIDKANSICIISHRNPDGDTVGSGLGLKFALEKYGKKVDIYCHDKPKGRLTAIPGVESYITQFEKGKKYDLAIAVDSASLDRLGDFGYIFSTAKKSCQIDHHISNNKYAANINIVEESGANCENIAMFLIYLRDIKKIDLFNEKTVDCLYTGLITDTGSFAFQSVTTQTMYVAWVLKELGAHSAEIIEHHMRSIEYNVFLLKKRVLDKVLFYSNRKIGIVILDKKDFEETGTDLSSTDGLIQNIVNINGLECAIMLSEASQNSYKVSVRTKTIDAVHIVEELGNGGGHPRAAGCRVNGIIEEIIDKILTIVKGMI